MKIFEVNTEIYVGDKFDEIVNKIKPKKVFIVTDSVMSKIGMTKKFEKYTKYKIFIVIALTVIAVLLFMLAGYRMSN